MHSILPPSFCVSFSPFPQSLPLLSLSSVLPLSPSLFPILSLLFIISPSFLSFFFLLCFYLSFSSIPSPSLPLFCPSFDPFFIFSSFFIILYFSSFPLFFSSFYVCLLSPQSLPLFSLSFVLLLFPSLFYIFFLLFLLSPSFLSFSSSSSIHHSSFVLFSASSFFSFPFLFHPLLFYVYFLYFLTPSLTPHFFLSNHPSLQPGDVYSLHFYRCLYSLLTLTPPPPARPLLADIRHTLLKPRLPAPPPSRTLEGASPTPT